MKQKILKLLQSSLSSGVIVFFFLLWRWKAFDLTSIEFYVAIFGGVIAVLVRNFVNKYLFRIEKSKE